MRVTIKRLAPGESVVLNRTVEKFEFPSNYQGGYSTWLHLGHETPVPGRGPRWVTEYMVSPGGDTVVHLMRDDDEDDEDTAPA